MLSYCIGAVAVSYFVWVWRVNTSIDLKGPFAFLPYIGPLIPEIRADKNLGKYHEIIARNANKYGGVFRYQVGGGVGVLFANPEGAKHVLQTAWEKYDRPKRLIDVFKRVAGGLIMMRNGEKWKRDRQLFQQAFNSTGLMKMHSIVDEKIDRVVTLFGAIADSGEQVDLQTIFNGMTFDIIGRVALGKEFNTLEDPNARIGHAWVEALEMLMWKFFVPPYWLIYKTKYIQRGEEQLEYLEDLFFQIIREKQETEISQDDNSLLAHILRCQKDNPEFYTNEDVKVHMMTFLFAGHDTTSNALTWMLYFISIHPEVEKKLLEEFDQVLVDGELSNDKMSKLNYLNCVVRETLRIRPSAPSMGRELSQDDNFHGVQIPAQTFCGWSAYGIHHNEEVWKDPEVFNPDRFLPENLTGMHPYAYVPFGGGPRRCVGEKLALKELKLAVVKILPLFKLTPVPGHPVEAMARATLFAKYGVKVTVERR